MSELSDAWVQLLAEHPELKDMPDPDSPLRFQGRDRVALAYHQTDIPIESVEEVAEAGMIQQQIELWLESLPEPDREIMYRFRRGESVRYIGRHVCRTFQAVQQRTKYLESKLKKYMNHLTK